MRKALLTLVILFLTITAFAQFNQGRMMIGGAISIQSYKEKSKSGSTTTTWGNTTEFSVTPQFGYFVIDNLAVGAGLNNSFWVYKADGSDEKATSSSFQFQPFVRYYLPQKIFFQGAFGVGAGKDVEYDDDETKYGLSSWTLAAGYAILLNNNVAIEPMLGYGSSVTKYKDADPEYKTIDSGLFIQVGIQVYIGK